VGQFGGFFFTFFHFFFFHIMYSLLKVQETAWSASYDESKTCKQSNGPLHLVMAQSETPHPNDSNQT